MQKSINLVILIALLLVILTLGYVSSLAMTPGSMLWYALLNKSSLNPPDNVFAPVWTVLYILMALSLWRILTHPYKPLCKYALGLFALQLFLNMIWSFIFFYNQAPTLALIDLALLDFIVLITIYKFYKIDKTAAYLLIPYILWLCLATYLNYFVVTHNVWIIN